ncbi:hypothetical protein ABZT02_41370 [Streptomyces sp. NPDC005402]|uniref:hypothetical protein n=1 Tax=Streptomyces sp. NPDC005402 TaxID=3155338 RepID=UPI0033B8C6B5
MTVSRKGSAAVEKWGADLYGDPCRGCGYGWSLTPQEAIQILLGLPAQFRALLDGCTGQEHHPDLSWGPTAYVCHVADNLRAWAEGLAAGVRLSAEVAVPGYDPDLLAKARRYDRIAPAAALWSLERAAAAWSEAVTAALHEDVVLQHAARGVQRAEDVARNNAHDAFHHVWDIRRILEYASPPPSETADQNS